MSELKIIISGGGTGGHIFPAISIANAIRELEPRTKILFVGAEGRMEMQRVPSAGYEIVGLPIRGLYRPLWKPANIGVVIDFLKSKRIAKKTLQEFKPDVAVGVGGYASSATLNAAYDLGIPCLIQEQNSYAGLTNKTLAKKAQKICVAYEGMERFFPKENIILTGNPVRQGLLDPTLTKTESSAIFGLEPDLPTVLIIGGSLGARTINDSIIAGLESIAANEDIQVIWQSGKIYDDRCREALESSQATNVKQMPFISNMDRAYRAADLVISRAGASSISELQLLGKASILVPSPNVAEDHQTKNAMALVNRNAALMIPDAEAVEKLVPVMLDTIAQEQVLEKLSENVGKMALHNAAEVIVDKLLQIAR